VLFLRIPEKRWTRLASPADWPESFEAELGLNKDAANQELLRPRSARQDITIRQIMRKSDNLSWQKNS